MQTPGDRVYEIMNANREPISPQIHEQVNK